MYICICTPCMQTQRTDKQWIFQAGCSTQGNWHGFALCCKITPASCKKDMRKFTWIHKCCGRCRRRCWRHWVMQRAISGHVVPVHMPIRAPGRERAYNTDARHNTITPYREVGPKFCFSAIRVDLSNSRVHSILFAKRFNEQKETLSCRQERRKSEAFKQLIYRDVTFQPLFLLAYLKDNVTILI